MSTIVYLNGEFLPLEEAKISPIDRGFLFADGIYEVSAVLDGKMIENGPHMARLERSLGEIDMVVPWSMDEVAETMQQVADKNEIIEGMVYLQITRGADWDKIRDFGFPKDPKPTMFMFAQHKNLSTDPAAATGIRVITIPEIRWGRRDIKSVALLAQTLGKQAAKDAGVDDAWMVEDDLVTEGTSNSAFIITENDELIARPLTNEILPGITRIAVLKLAEELQLKVIEGKFSAEQAYKAKEAFSTSASALVAPVIEIDGHKIGNGKPGQYAIRLRELYLEEARKSII
jgi:D-alanine transaminase